MAAEKKLPYAIRIAKGTPDGGQVLARAETPEQAQARAEQANAKAQELGIDRRYEADSEPSE